MGLGDVKNGLRKELDKERTRLKKEADERIKEIQERVDEEIKDYEERVRKETAQQIEALKRKELASEKLRQQKALLMAKKDLIDEAFTDAQDALKDMSDEKRKEMIAKLRKRADEEIKVKTVWCAEQDIKLAGKGAKADEDITGGIICENADGTRRIDLTLERLLEDVRSTHLKEVADTLLA